jgi:hypothetical protein
MERLESPGVLRRYSVNKNELLRTACMAYHSTTREVIAIVQLVHIRFIGKISS